MLFCTKLVIKCNHVPASTKDAWQGRGGGEAAEGAAAAGSGSRKWGGADAVVGSTC